MRLLHLAGQFATVTWHQGLSTALRATAVKTSRWMLRISGYELSSLEARMMQKQGDWEAQLSETQVTLENRLAIAVAACDTLARQEMTLLEARVAQDRQTSVRDIEEKWRGHGQAMSDLQQQVSTALATADAASTASIASTAAAASASDTAIAAISETRQHADRQVLTLQQALDTHARAAAAQDRRVSELVRQQADSLRVLTHLTLVHAPPPIATPAIGITVIIPVHNRAVQVKNSIDSVLAQHYAQVELVVVDDGSTDELAASMAAYSTDPRVRFLSLPRGGENRARNAGLRAASGQVIVNLDSDNCLYAGYLERLAEAYAIHPDAQCALAAMLWDDQGTTVHLRHDRFDWNGLFDGSVAVDTNAFSYRTRVWQELGGWDETLTRLSDYELALRYTRRYPPLRVDAVAAVYDFRKVGNRISTTRAHHPNRIRIHARYHAPAQRPLKVLVVCYDYPQLSESYIDAEIAWMTRQGVRMEVCSMTLPGAAGEAMVRVHQQGVAQALTDFKPDLIHCHWLHLADAVTATARTLRLPVTVRSHSFEFTPETLATCEAHDVVRSIYLFPHLAALHASDHPAVIPVPVCFDSERYYPRHLAKDRRMVLRAAACLDTKDIDSFFHIAMSCPDHRFVLALAHIAGRPALPAYFERLNESLGNPVEIRWNVSHGQMADLYAQAGIYLHTFGFSQTFGMPMSIAESMACGCVPLLRDCEAARVYAGDCAFYYNTPAEAASQLRALSRWTEAQWSTQAVVCAEHAFLHYADETVLPAILKDWLTLTEPSTYDVPAAMAYGKVAA